jgi:hypothetical protein
MNEVRMWKVSGMRKALLSVVGAWAALALAGLFARRPVRSNRLPSMVDPRPARDAYLDRHAIGAERYARITSLWGDRSGVQCRVAASWGDKPASASFTAQMRLSMRAPLIAALAAKTLTTSAPDLAAANDADIANRLVTLQPGSSPVVRILRQTSFRPRRATFGAVEAIAA